MITTSQKYRWRLLQVVPRGHKWFIDEATGGIAVGDYSGATPDRTEDGVLWLDKTQAIIFGHSRHISVPVISERTSHNFHIISNVAELLYLMRKHGMELCIESDTDHANFKL